MYPYDFPQYIKGRQSFFQSSCETPLRLHILLGEFQKYFFNGNLDKGSPQVFYFKKDFFYIIFFTSSLK